MILALMLAAAQPQVFAVLEFRDKVPAEQRIDVPYLSDQVRAAVKDLMPQEKVITRENMLVLLQASGKDLSACEGECEVDTGRRIGADLVVSGELLRFGTQYKLNMKLHDTRSGELISGAVASGGTADALDHDLRPAVGRLLAPLLQDTHAQRRDEARRELLREERARRYRTVAVSIWGTLGYASLGVSGTGLTASSTSGFAYGFGGQLFLHVAGPLYLGALADYSFFPGLSGGRTDGALLAGGARFDLGDVVVSGGAGYANLSNGGGSGFGLLGALEYGILRLQLAWRHCSSSGIQVATAFDQTVDAISGQAGLSITF